MIVPGAGFSGYVAVQIPENATKIYTDEAVRQMFASAVTRKQVSAEEQIGLMPFSKITDLADFKDIRTLAPGSSIILADGNESSGYESKPFMILGLIGATPRHDRGRFAQEAARQIPGVRDWRVTMSEPIRIDGPPGFETRVDAISGKAKTPVTVVQWLRFRQRQPVAAHHRQHPARRVVEGAFRASALCATAFSRGVSSQGLAGYRVAAPRPAFAGFFRSNGTWLSLDHLREANDA